MGAGSPGHRERPVTGSVPAEDSEELILNMGPQHPSTHGVMRVILKLDGERVKKVRMRDRLSASRRRKDRREPHLGAVRSLCRPHGLRFRRLERSRILFGRRTIDRRTRAAARAQVTRVILTELNRIASHLLWLGTHAIDIGAMTPLFYTFREREEILKIFENYCGARLTTHAFRIGGLQYELYDGFEKEVRAFCELFLRRIDEYEQLLTANRIWRGRLRGIGILNAADCKDYGVTGPVLARGRRLLGSAQSPTLLRLRAVRV